MKAVSFPEANVTLVAPGCDDMPAMLTGQQIISTWELEPAEVAALYNGGRIRLAVWSERSHPPVMLWVA